ncbi:uncharacterized protein [Neodiprion pinetum]|uniref:Uncharacterized protein LOC107219389 n=2 Tax=Neodiprion lecontei TaxID=441921 RepID=A0A6J0BDX7_NEOLC|nr:uncharacterized protein LOC107219389 isoform X1 [Neodiprion lecontei]XP_046464881.1 uncharacterized protein LOC124210690 isoform X1 [Neodiprion pinetum]XP_046464882.1 uncharacterized protein LOC124210690 isoform X1 [Neodiprion pinetum]XP_046464883.1 uncharacterized protein LOC124210690 isoform X1 [Neodiprion pinetum]XP_046585762.1 uncharacterized protein LOC107219389 isoform X1 [Neodiprion lecontei]
MSNISGTGVFLMLELFASTFAWPIFDFWPLTPSLPLNTFDLYDGGGRDARVLNFFPIPVEEECLSEDKRRVGICMNTYECRIQQGKSHGPCALGFGVCCIFTTSCGEEVQNNLTYVTSPGFPNLINQSMNCSLTVKKIDPQVSQLRIDFLHFNIGQPNRRTGICDADIMEIRTGIGSLNLCGWNSGQHIYVDVDDGPITLNFRLPSSLESRMWEMRITQVGFEQRAPAGCLQYHVTPRGTLRTLNYLPNGRYLASQDHLLCVRQERGMCSISYAPCATDSFRIGPPRSTGPASNMGGLEGQVVQGEGSGTGAPVFESASRCRDRVLIPCDFEEFITPGNDGAGICDLEHCGNSLCNQSELDDEGNCRVETSATPFHIRVAFGPGEDNGLSSENNVGMCLSYEQLPCGP